MAETDKNFQRRNRVAEEEGFKDKTVFISGGTGFMGKVLIEKTLRTASSVKKIYILIRTKKGKDPQDRLKEVFSSALFDVLKQAQGENILKKVVAIPGDVMEVNMGISKEHRKMLAEETQIIFHLAATIRFDEPLKKAVLLNTRGTKYMLDFAKECKKLLVFNYISTAYCHLEEKILYEKAYPPPADPHVVIQAVEWLDEKILDSITDQILGKCPNTYAFTKALAESLVNDEMDNLPVVILRPSVVIPIWKDPLPGWTDNINGPSGLLIAAGKGVLRTMFCESQGYADFLPVDIAVNVLMLSVVDYMVYRTRRIYNITSSFEFKVTWQEIIELGRKVVETRMPLNGVVWYPGGSLKKSRLLHNICVVLLQYVPAAFLDTIIYLSGNKPVLWRVQNRITAGYDVFEYYANNQWDFNNDGSLEARRLMTERENELYKVDGQGMDLEDYFYHCTHGARLYILKETDDTIPSARRHMNIMWVLDKFCKMLILVGFGYLLLHYFIYPVLGIDS